MPSIRECYSIVKNPIKGTKISVFDMDLNIYTADGKDNNILFRRKDNTNVYVSDDEKTIVVKPPNGISGNYTKAIFHDFRIYGYSQVQTADLISSKYIEFVNPLFLKCRDVNTLSKIVLKSHWNDYKSQYIHNLPSGFNVSSELSLELSNYVGNLNSKSIEDTLTTFFNSTLDHDILWNIIEIYCTDICFDIEWVY